MLVLGSTIIYNKDLIPEIFSITNNLTNCASDNVDTEIIEGQSYSATITPSTGYTLSGATVSVLMDGVDITSTAYNNGVITIAEVTGNIVINVSSVIMIYGITNNLTNCTSNNAATTIQYGSSYSATLTADTDYTMTGATVSV